MNKKTLALVDLYAKSLVDVALEHDAVKPVTDDIKAMLAVFDSHKDLQSLFATDSMEASEKAKIVRLFQEQASPYVTNFLEVLLQNERESFLYPILHSASDQMSQATRKFDVEVRTAVPLSDEQKRRLQEIVEEKFELQQDRLIEIVDQSLVGGFVVKADNRVIDTSIRRQLQDLKMNLK